MVYSIVYLSLLQPGLATSPAKVQQVVAAHLGLYHPVQASLKVRLLSYYAITQLLFVLELWLQLTRFEQSLKTFELGILTGEMIPHSPCSTPCLISVSLQMIASLVITLDLYLKKLDQ